jgi:hypothetical protein
VEGIAERIAERVGEIVGDDGGLVVGSSVVVGGGVGGAVEEQVVVVIVGRLCRCMKRSLRVTVVCLVERAGCQVGGIEMLVLQMLTAGCSWRPAASA